MALVSAASLVGTAYARGTGVAAVDVSTLEQAEGVLLGAEQAGLPVILQVSQATATFHLGDPGALAAALGALARTSLVDVGLHLDRATADGLLHRAAEYGFSSVQVDAGDRPEGEGVGVLAEGVRWGHRHGLLVQGELPPADNEPVDRPAIDAPTEPERAADFVAQSGVDALVLGAGPGPNDGTRAASESVDVERIRRLAGAVSVPLVWRPAAGVPQPAMAPAVTAGVTVVCFGAVTTLALTRAIRQQLRDLPDVHDPRQYLAPARKAVAAVSAELVATVGLAPASR